MTENPEQSSEVPVKNFEYDNDDDINTDLDVSEYKYTTIDCLDEDDPIQRQKFVIMSFISPEGIMNCNVRGLKIRGVFETEAEAQKKVKELQKKDKHFDILIGEVGKWMPWDPSTRQVEKIKYRNKNLNKIMEKVHQNELKTLNEVVGRKKEMLDVETKAHRARVKETIKESVKNYDDTSKPDTAEPVKQDPPKRNHSNPEATRQRLQKTLEERRKARQSEENSVKQLSYDKQTLETETARVNEKSKNVSDLKRSSKELDEKIQMMKQYYEQKKSNDAT